jgi:hypothetical protein
MIFLSSCGKGGAGISLSGGGNPVIPTQDIIVSGSVQAPSGQIAFSGSKTLFKNFAEIIIPTANALIPGLSIVPDGTTVELASINDTGALVSTLSTTTVSGGTYSFDFTKLKLSFSSNLIVRVQNANSGIQMRAFVGIGVTNINPVSEAAVTLVLDTINANPGISLPNFTPQEQNDITASIDLFSTVNNLGSGVDINSTVILVKNAILANSGIMSFITAASVSGQTTSGPGDIGNYMPVSTGNTWILQDQTTPSSGSQTSYTETDSFMGTTIFNGTAMSVLTVTTTGQSATTIQNYFVKNSTGYFEYGDDDPTDLLLPQISPITQLIFPIQPGRTFGQINKKGLNYGQDLDGDGIPETFDFSYSSTYIGFETTTVLAGTFPNSIKITTNITETITLSKTKQQVIVTLSQDLWLAPGIGPVNSISTTQGKSNDIVYSSEVDTSELTSFYKTATFGPAANYMVGSSPAGLATGDFNGDGVADLAVTNQYDNNISIFLGVGNGSFGAATYFAVGIGPVSVAVGDFNGDGKLDLAVVNYGNPSVSILLGDGTGSFSAATNYTVGMNPTDIAIADFNGDGKLDLAVMNSGYGSVSIFLGTGTGSFGAPTSFAASGSKLAIGDFNGDGKLDLATNGNNSVSILLGDGTGSFGAATNFPVSLSPSDLAVGDFNGDGKLDLAVTERDSNSVSILIGNGDGTFKAPSNFAVGSYSVGVVVGDFNRDGKLDLAVLNRDSATVSILVGDGKGSFVLANSLSVELDSFNLASGDFNGDGKPDLAVTSSNLTISNIKSLTIFLNTTP